MNDLQFAEDVTTSSEVLAQLSDVNDLSVRCAVARNPSTPPEVLDKLAKEVSIHVRVEVARNPSAFFATTALLATDEYFVVRSVVAMSPTTPPAILETLAADSDAIVRREVAMNPNTLPETLSALRADPSLEVRFKAEARPNTPPASSTAPESRDEPQTTLETASLRLAQLRVEHRRAEARLRALRYVISFVDSDRIERFKVSQEGTLEDLFRVVAAVRDAVDSRRSRPGVTAIVIIDEGIQVSRFIVSVDELTTSLFREVKAAFEATGLLDAFPPIDPDPPTYV